MKIYSILVHPNKESLNARLSSLADKFFQDQGHTVESINLYQHVDQITQSVSKFYQNTVSVSERQYASPYTYNYGHSKKVLDKFALTEIEKLKSADLLFIQSPIMVWTIPAMLKLYIEAVFIQDGLFAISEPWNENFKIESFLIDNKVFCSFTMGSGKAMTEHITGSEDALINPISTLFKFVGYEWIPPHMTWGTQQTANKREDYFASFQQSLVDRFSKKI